MKDRILSVTLFLMSLGLSALVCVTVPFIVFSALGADVPDFTPAVVVVLLALAVAGHIFVAVRLARSRTAEVDLRPGSGDHAWPHTETASR